ncbi:MAG: phosphodiester glycosidase family protein [Bacteroidales bacterium]
MKRLSLFLSLFIIMQVGFSQTAEDSVKIVKANWSPKKIDKGVVHKHAPFKYLYGAPQNVNVIEVAPAKKKKRIGILVNEPLRKTSHSAESVNALAAINGSYFDIKKGNSVCFLKIGPDVMDTTSGFELAFRVNGALRIDNGELSLMPWNKQIEAQYADQDDIVMASGPLMLRDGNTCDFSGCDSAFIHKRHPRSAIGMRENGQLVLVVVDGRAPNHAVGMSIPEFAYLMKQLGCTDALNLDGGGSTTLWVDSDENEGIVNKPCDNRHFDAAGERKVANIIYIK